MRYWPTGPDPDVAAKPLYRHRMAAKWLYCHPTRVPGAPPRRPSPGCGPGGWGSGDRGTGLGSAPARRAGSLSKHGRGLRRRSRAGTSARLRTVGATVNTPDFVPATLTSADGTTIAYETAGTGSAVIVLSTVAKDRTAVAGIAAARRAPHSRQRRPSRPRGQRRPPALRPGPRDRGHRRPGRRRRRPRRSRQRLRRLCARPRRRVRAR